MKKLLLLLLFSAWLAAPGGAQILVDHHCTKLSLIPQTWIDQAKANLRVSYQHTSHGSQPVRGMYTLSQLYPSMVFSWTGSDYYTGGSGDPGGYNAGVFFNDFGMLDMYGDLGHLGDMTWVTQTTDLLNQPGGCNRNVVIWSWCAGVSDNDVAGINTYLHAMDSLEQLYPAVTFVYMTGHLDGTGAAGNLHQMNELIRNYCQTNGKILFDFADIESYDPDGLVNYMELYATDGCQYDSASTGDPWTGPYWTTNWINNNPGDSLVTESAACGECLHSEHLNCMLKGRAFWWLLARIAGWDGAAALPDEQTVENAATFNAYYNAPDNAIEILLGLTRTDRVSFTLYDITGRLVYRAPARTYQEGEHLVSIPLQDPDKELYFIKMQSSSGTVSRKVLLY